MSQLTTNHWGTVEPIVRHHFGIGKSKQKGIFSKIFTVSKGKEAIKHSMEHGGPSTMSAKTEGDSFAELQAVSGPNKTWTYTVYGGVMRLSYELLQDSRYDAIKNRSKMLGNTMRLTPEYLAAQFLDRAFSSSYPATADGKALCTTDHLILGTGTSDGSNELATPQALSEGSIEDIYEQVTQMKGPDGLIDPVMCQKLIVPPALMHVAKKLQLADREVGSANNTKSVIGGFEVLVNPFLTDANNYFFLTDRDNGLFWEWAVESDLAQDNDILTMDTTWRAMFRARWGCEDWRAIFGVEVA